MTSTIAIVALLHAIPILLTGYISQSKSKVRTAAVIMAFVAFFGGAFQYILVDLIVVFVAYVYAFDKWCDSEKHTIVQSQTKSRKEDVQPQPIARRREVRSEKKNRASIESEGSQRIPKLRWKDVRPKKKAWWK